MGVINAPPDSVLSDLNRCTLFGGLPAGELEALASVVGRGTYQRHDFLVWAGRGGSDVYVVVKGEVSLGYEMADGRHVPLLPFDEGEVCGIVFQSPRIRDACHLQVTSRYAILDCIPITFIDRLNERYPAFRQRYQELLLDRVADALAHVVALATLTTDEHLRLRLADRARLHPDHLVQDTEEELAAWLAVSRSRVATLLRPLFEAGAIEHPRVGRGIVVPRPDDLAQL